MVRQRDLLDVQYFGGMMRTRLCKTVVMSKLESLEQCWTAGNHREIDAGEA